MGCILGTFPLASQVPLYLMSTPHECINLTFNFNRGAALSPTLIPFDDAETVLRNA
jgi:hypothetical protein